MALKFKVALFPFKARDVCGRPLLLEPVEITNVFAAGPRARQMLPPDFPSTVPESSLEWLLGSRLASMIGVD